MVERRVLPGPPVRVEYGLTEMGRDLAPALDELKRWAHRWLGGDSARAPESEPLAAGRL
jgi:DNA-binding HxlR family transcriptional regulator